MPPIAKQVLKTGTKLGSLTVLAWLSRRAGGAGGRFYYSCRCDCGTLLEVRSDSLYPIQKQKSCKNCYWIVKKIPDQDAALTFINHQYRTSARHRELKFELSKQELKELIYSNCHYCGATPEVKGNTCDLNQAKDRRAYRGVVKYNGVDRVDSDLGYIKSNVVPCCYICNVMKWELTVEQFKNHILDIVKYNKWVL